MKIENWDSFFVNLTFSFECNSQLNANNKLMLLKQPLADAIYYKNHDVIKLLEKRGAKPVVRFEFCQVFFIF